MKVNIGRIKGEPGARMSVQRREDVGPLGEANPTGPVEIRADLVNTGPTLALSGTAKVPVTLRCARCLDELSLCLEAQLEDQYREAPGPPAEEELRRALEEEGVILYHGDEIDLRGPVRESLLLAIPMQPLCRPECRGICPACGTDLNRQPCECAAEAVDPRFEALRQLNVKNERPEER